MCIHVSQGPQVDPDTGRGSLCVSWLGPVVEVVLGRRFPTESRLSGLPGLGMC